MVFEPTAIDSPTAKKYQLVGGALCLDFCNTVGGKREGIARENLHSYEHFLSWCEQVHLVSKTEVARLRQNAETVPEQATEVLGRAVALREAIYHIFFALAKNAGPAEADLKLINAELAKNLGRLRVMSEGETNGFKWVWALDKPALDYPLGPLAHSAANLLISHECCALVRQCRGDNCGWLFLDSSKNHSRCWCDMRDCGNRAKVRRHRQKHRDS